MTVNTLKTIGERVKHARNCLNLTQLAVGELMGVNQKSVSNLEKNMGFSTTMLTRAARALQVDLNWLQHGRGDAPEPNSRTRVRSSPTSQIAQFGEQLESMQRLFMQMNENIQQLNHKLDRLLESQQT